MKMHGAWVLMVETIQMMRNMTRRVVNMMRRNMRMMKKKRKHDEHEEQNETDYDGEYDG